MASAMAANTAAVHNVRSSRVPHIGPSSTMNGERVRVSPGATMGAGFSGGKASWNSNIWGSTNLGNGFADGSSEATTVRDNAFESKSGSGSLFSDAHGWSGHPNLLWGTVNSTTSSLSMAPKQSLTMSPVQSRANDRGAPALSESNEKTSYFALPRTSTIGPTSSASAPRTYLASTSDALPSATGDIPFVGGSLGGLRNDDTNRRQLNSSAFIGNGVNSGFQAKTGHVAGDRDGSRSEDIMSLPPFSQTSTDSISPGVSRAAASGPYTHLSRNSVSFVASQKPVHSAHPSFHSDTHAFENRFSNSPMDVNASFSKLELHDDNGFLSQQNQPRPAFVSHSSYDTTFNRFKYPTAADENFQQASPYTLDGSPELQFGCHPGATRLNDRGSTSSSEYSRNMTPNFYSAGTTPPGTTAPYRTSSGSRLSSHTNEGQNVDRKLRPPERDFIQSAANPLQSRLHFPHGYDLSGFTAARLGSFSSFYPVTHLGTAAIVPRSPHREHDTSQIVRSALLEEFRSNSKGNKRYELKDIYTHIVEFSGDQHGSRFIQQKLETANSDEKEQVFREIQPNSLQLMTDVFGNYVVQKLFEHGNQSQKKILANQMKGHILNLSIQMYGCRVVQKALEHILTDQQASMVKELENYVLKCVKDQNGNHVIQKAIERVPSQHVQFIINAFKGQVNRLAAHPYGCRVIQRMLEHCEEADRQSILAELHACTATLITDQFGNYVIQHVIENGEEKDRSRIISIVISQLLVFSKHKFASNVVEKSIEFGEEGQQSEIIRLLTSPNERGDSPLLGLMRDQYGNYVIQKVLGQMKGAAREALVEQIKPLLSQLKKFSYGKQIVAIEKLICDPGTLSPGTSPGAANQSTTPPASHKSSPQPSRRSLTDLQGCRPPVGGAAPPTPPPTDTQSCHGGSTESSVSSPADPCKVMSATVTAISGVDAGLTAGSAMAA